MYGHLKLTGTQHPFGSLFRECRVFTQAFMAIRYWRVANRSYIFAVLTGSGILLAFAGGIWMTVDYGERDPFDP